jgi:polygalacturonase
MRLVTIVQLLSLLLFLGCTDLHSQYDKKLTSDGILENIKAPLINGVTIYLNDFGAVGNGVFDNKKAFDQAINNLEKNGGGHLIVNEGIYKIDGPIHLISNMNLHLAKGVKLMFGSDPKNYLPVVKTSWEGTFLYNYSPFIYAYGCNNVSITGQGVIDGEAANTWSTWVEKQVESQQLSRDMNHNRIPIEKRIFGEGYFLRPHLIQFYDCKNVLVEGVKIEDSPFWCLHLLECDNVIIRGLSYDAQNMNNDGIDPEYSRNVLIENITFNNHDDNVAIKAGRDDDGRNADSGTENIVIRNCTFKGKPAIAIGSEMSAGVQNVFVENCQASGKLMRGVYIKSNPDRGGFIRNIYFSNLQFDEVEDCIYVSSFYHNEGEGHVSDISDIYFNNITCRKASGTGIVIQGFTEKNIRDIYFKDITINWAENGISMVNSENIIMSNVLIGELATKSNRAGR